MEGYKVEVDIQVRFADTDALGHVNNAVYLSWMELGRMAYTDTVLPQLNWAETGFILAHVSIDYLEPVFLQDKVKVYMKAGKIGTKSVVLECLITKTDKNGERPTAKGTNIIVAFDYQTNKSLPIPKDWKWAMCK